MDKDLMCSIFGGISGCGAGKYMNGQECTDCGVGTFQDKPFHTDTVCIGCSGQLTVLSI